MVLVGSQLTLLESGIYVSSILACTRCTAVKGDEQLIVSRRHARCQRKRRLADGREIPDRIVGRDCDINGHGLRGDDVALTVRQMNLDRHPDRTRTTARSQQNAACKSVFHRNMVRLNLAFARGFGEFPAILDRQTVANPANIIDSQQPVAGPNRKPWTACDCRLDTHLSGGIAARCFKQTRLAYDRFPILAFLLGAERRCDL